MTTETPYQKAERKIAKALRTGATELNLGCRYNADDSEKLIELPESLGQLTQLQTLNLARNQLTTLPESLGQLTQLQELNLYGNQLTTLPESLQKIRRLKSLNLHCAHRMKQLPEWLGNMTQLQSIELGYRALDKTPEWLSQLVQLERLSLSGHKLTDVPEYLLPLKKLRFLNLNDNQLTAVPNWIGNRSSLNELLLGGNPLNPELAAAYEQGLDAVKAYLRAKAEAQIVLNEAKLILIGEGEVGKSCLLDALRDEPWQKTRVDPWY